MGVLIENITISQNPVNTGEQFKISVLARCALQEPIFYRMPFKLGTKKGGKA